MGPNDYRLQCWHCNKDMTDKVDSGAVAPKEGEPWVCSPQCLELWKRDHK